MNNLIFSIDPTYFYFYFGIFSVIAIAVGVVLYFMLRKEEPSTTQYGSTVAPVSNFVPKLAAICVIIAIILYAYRDTWVHFYTASIKDDRLYLGYYLPQRIVEIPDMKNLAITSEKASLKGEKYRIRIKIADQREFVSQIMDEDSLKINLEKLANSVNTKKH
ncbi:MAG TPA: hypothetical protein P5294_00250 [Smithellaceae bacterium]|nr:hypothetical protein [Smithellaceae bacterium]HRS88292.1 hypothetical protein [Smithellaceae bacterium]HRV24937.1 hypothetical protein [Smithellaceae bacterium]